jgi:hypothetical protein
MNRLLSVSGLTHGRSGVEVQKSGSAGDPNLLEVQHWDWKQLDFRDAWSATRRFSVISFNHLTYLHLARQ